MVDPIAITSSVQTFVTEIYLLVGGIAGFYVILIALRWWEYRMMKIYLRDIKTELEHLNDNLGFKRPLISPHFISRQLETITNKINRTKKRKIIKKRKVNKKRKSN